MSADVEYTKEELEAIKVLSHGVREEYYANLLTKLLAGSLSPSLVVHPKTYKKLYEQAITQNIASAAWVKNLAESAE